MSARQDPVKVEKGGRIRLPAQMLEALGIAEGDALDVQQIADCLVLSKGPAVDLDLLLKPLREEAKRSGYSEEQVLADVKRAREELHRELYPNRS